MTEQQMRARVRYVIGPDGSPLTVADLPPRDTKRWVIRRKAEVVAAVRGGLLSIAVRVNRPDMVSLLLDLGLDPDESVRLGGR